MSVSDWSATADENTSIDGINIAEHCPAKNMNDALRAVMAAVKNECDALQSDLGTCLRIGGGRLTGPLTLEGGESAEGVDSSGDTWIRYKSGLQLCWSWTGTYSASNNTSKTISYAKAFTNLPQTYVTMSGGGAGWANFNVTTSTTATAITITTWVNYGADITGYVGFNWMAIGFWK